MGRLVGSHELIKISVDSMLRLHQALDLRWNVKPPNQKRSRRRIAFKEMNVPLTVCNPLGESESHIVYCRDFCDRGIGALCVTFIYPGSRCSIVLHRVDGQREMFTGRVSNCVHVYKRLHRIGISLLQPIDVEEFTGPPDDAS